MPTWATGFFHENLMFFLQDENWFYIYSSFLLKAGWIAVCMSGSSTFQVGSIFKICCWLPLVWLYVLPRFLNARQRSSVHSELVSILLIFSGIDRIYIRSEQNGRATWSYRALSNNFILPHFVKSKFKIVGLILIKGSISRICGKQNGLNFSFQVLFIKDSIDPGSNLKCEILEATKTNVFHLNEWSISTIFLY